MVCQMQGNGAPGAGQSGENTQAEARKTSRSLVSGAAPAIC